MYVTVYDKLFGGQAAPPSVYNLKLVSPSSYYLEHGVVVFAPQTINKTEHVTVGGMFSSATSTTLPAGQTLATGNPTIQGLVVYTLPKTEGMLVIYFENDKARLAIKGNSTTVDKALLDDVKNTSDVYAYTSQKFHVRCFVLRPSQTVAHKPLKISVHGIKYDDDNFLVNVKLAMQKSEVDSE